MLDYGMDELRSLFEIFKPLLAVAGPAIAVGVTGSLIEWIGMRTGIVGLERLGKSLESVAADLPKLKTNLMGPKA